MLKALISAALPSIFSSLFSGGGTTEKSLMPWETNSPTYSGVEQTPLWGGSSDPYKTPDLTFQEKMALMMEGRQNSGGSGFLQAGMQSSQAPAVPTPQQALALNVFNTPRPQWAPPQMSNLGMGLLFGGK